MDKCKIDNSHHTPSFTRLPNDLVRHNTPLLENKIIKSILNLNIWIVIVFAFAF